MTRVWTDDGFRNVLGADPKPVRRVKADQNEWVRLRKEKLGPCRVCAGRGTMHSAPMQLHHLVPRGMGGGGGDDVPENLVPLCSDCHRLIEARDPWASTLLGQRLTNAERAYVDAKRPGYLEQRYGWRDAA